MVEEFSYQQQILYFSKKNRISESSSRNFIKVYRRLLKDNLKIGKCIEVSGIVKIYPSVRESVCEIFEPEDIYDYESQIVDLYNETEFKMYEVHSLLKSYIRMIHLRLKMGYLIKLSGVFQIRPDLLEDNTFGYVTRLSATLEKPDMLELKVKRIYGNIDTLELEKSKIIFRLELNEDLGKPERLRLIKNDSSKLNFISDDLLG